MPLGPIALLVSTAMRAEHERLVQLDLRPRSDYAVLSHLLDAEIVDFTRISADRRPEVHFAYRALGPGNAQALWAYFNRGRYELLFSDSERIGIPLAALLRGCGVRPRHVMIAHWLSRAKKLLPLRLMRLHTRLDGVVCHNALQLRIGERLGIPSGKLNLVPYGVDHLFWRPLPFDYMAPAMICAAGTEQRDYATLVAAVRDIGVETTIAADSRSVDPSQRCPLARGLPPNVHVGSLNSAQLRALYARSSFVVVPLLDRDFAVGLTAVLEAMAMGKAVILSATRGIVDTGGLDNGVTGLYVPPGDVAALREAILYLALNRGVAEGMGQAGRRKVEAGLTLDHFVGRLKQIVVDSLEVDSRETPLASGGQS